MTRKEKREETFDFARARWRVSDRSDGSTTCVEVATDGVIVALGNSNARHPHGPALLVPVHEWLDFIDYVRTGQADHTVIITPRPIGSFLVDVTANGCIEVCRSSDPNGSRLRYTPEEWDVFVEGVVQDGEFTLTWLLDTPVSA